MQTSGEFLSDDVGTGGGDDPQKGTNDVSHLIKNAKEAFDLYEDRHQIDDLHNAIALYQRALSSRPNDPDIHDSLGLGLYSLFQQTSSAEDIDQSIAYHARSLELFSPESDDRRWALFYLGNRYLFRYEEFHNTDDLATSIRYLERAKEQDPCVELNLNQFLNNVLTNLALSHEHRFYALHNSDDLERAVDYCRQALQCCPVDNDLRCSSTFHLAETFRKWFGSQKTEPAVIDEAIVLYRRVLEISSPDLDEHGQSLAHMSFLLCSRYQETSCETDLEESVNCATNALSQLPISDSFKDERRISSVSLGYCLLLRFVRNNSDTPHDLDGSIFYNRQALALSPTPDGSPASNGLVQRLSERLAQGLVARFLIRDDMEDLGGAIDCYSSLLELAPPGHSDHSDIVHNLERVVVQRYNRLHDVRDLDTLIMCDKLVLDFEPSGSLQYAQRLEAISEDIMQRYSRLGQAQDLEEVIAYREEVLRVYSPDDSDYYMYLHNLGDTLRARFEHSGRVEDITRSLELHRKALALCLFNTDIKAALMAALASSFRQRGKCAIKHLREANEIAEDLRSQLTETAENRAALINLAILAGINHDHEESATDLDEAIRLGEKVQRLNSDPSNLMERSRTLNSLGSALRRRFLQRGDLEDLEKAISYYQTALKFLSPEHSNYPAVTIGLVSSLTDRFHAKSSIDDIDEAVNYGRRLLALPQLEARTHRFPMLSVVATALMIRNYHLLREADIREARAYYYEAKELHLTEAELWQCLMGIAQAHFYQRPAASLEDLDKAIESYGEALALSRIGDRRRFQVLSNLSGCHMTRFDDYQQDKIDLDKSIEYSEACIEGMKLYPAKTTSDALASATSNYLLGLLRRLETSDSKHLETIDSVIATIHELINTNIPPHSVARPTAFNHLGGVLYCRFKVSHEGHDLDEACSSFETALEQESIDIRRKIDIAQNWARKAHRSRHPSALEAYSRTLKVLQQYSNLRPELVSRRHLLEGFNAGALAVDAVSCTVTLGQSLENALERLEQGRNIIWSTMRSYRSLVPPELHKVNPQLAQEFQEVCSELEHMAVISEKSNVAPISPELTSQDLAPWNVYHEARWTRQRHLLEGWNSLVEKIRQIEKLKDFLLPPSFPDMQESVVDGPVIFLNVSKHQCDAIILTSHGHPTLVPLTSDLHDVSLDMANGLTELSRSEVRLNITPRRKPAETDPVANMLRRLWYMIGEPVSKALLQIGIQKGSRIWWCPTGALTFLPIHAAGDYMRDSEETNMLDLFVSSYTSSLGALATARANLKTRSRLDMQLLAIGQSNDLPKVLEEFDAMRKIMPGQVHFRDNADAEPSLVVQNLQEKSFPWVHFSCHGDLNGADPFHSSFRLSGKEPKLTLLSLIEAQLPAAELAFLASCNSAAASTSSAEEEVITLASAMQYCGFSSIVGTLWTMSDRDAPALSHDFYTYMLRNGPGAVDVKDSAKALNQAVKELRRRGVPPDRWSTFIHVGV